MERRTTKIWFVLGILAVMVLGLAAVKAAEGDMAKPAKECTMKDMHECVMKCTMHCDKNIKDMAAAMALLDEAVTAVDAGNTADAKMKIEQAKTLLKDMKAAQKKCMEKMPCCNAACPITGKPVDRMNVSKDLTTCYKGKKVGFCCPACPPAWEKLTDAEKDAKLEKVMPKMSEKEDMMKDMPKAEHPK